MAKVSLRNVYLQILSILVYGTVLMFKVGEETFVWSYSRVSIYLENLKKLYFRFLQNDRPSKLDEKSIEKSLNRRFDVLLKEERDVKKRNGSLESFYRRRLSLEFINLLSNRDSTEILTVNNSSRNESPIESSRKVSVIAHNLIQMIDFRLLPHFLNCSR